MLLQHSSNILTALSLSYYFMIVISFLTYWLIMSSAYKVIKGETVVNHQSVHFFIGFLICTSTFGLAVFVAEMSSYLAICIQTHCVVIFRFVVLLVILVSLLVFYLLALTKMFCCCPCSHWTSFKILVAAFFPHSCLAGSCSTLLFGFGYPLKMLPLIVLHVAFVFTVTVAFAVGLSDIIFWYNTYYTHRTTLHTRQINVFWHVVKDIIEFQTSRVIIIVFVWFGACLLYEGTMIGYELTVAQGFVTSDEANAVMFLVLSLVLFLMGLLIKLPVVFEHCPQQQERLYTLPKIITKVANWQPGKTRFSSSFLFLSSSSVYCKQINKKGSKQSVM